MFPAKTTVHRRSVAPAAFQVLTLERLEERDVPAGIVSVVTDGIASGIGIGGGGGGGGGGSFIGGGLIGGDGGYDGGGGGGGTFIGGGGDGDAYGGGRGGGGGVNRDITGDDGDNQRDIMRENGPVNAIFQSNIKLNSISDNFTTEVVSQEMVSNLHSGLEIQDISIPISGSHNYMRVFHNPINILLNFSVDLGRGNDFFLSVESSGLTNIIKVDFSLYSDNSDDLVFTYNTAPLVGSDLNFQLDEGHDIKGKEESIVC
jgi:hypothetical protein